MSDPMKRKWDDPVLYLHEPRTVREVRLALSKVFQMNEDVISVNTFGLAWEGITKKTQIVCAVTNYPGEPFSCDLDITVIKGEEPEEVPTVVGLAKFLNTRILLTAPTEKPGIWWHIIPDGRIQKVGTDSDEETELLIIREIIEEF